MEKILVVDDESLIRQFLYEALSSKGYHVELSSSLKEAKHTFTKDTFDILLLDLKLPDGTGTDFLQWMKHEHHDALVIIMTAYGTVENAVAAMQLGAFHYLLKPFALDVLETILSKAQEHLYLLRENAFLKSEKSLPSFVLESPSMRLIQQQIQKIARSSASVFISGESGTGKEVIAAMIMNASLRHDKPYIKVNCAAIPETLLESEFFGYEKGAFTGASQRKMGRFELAHQGTLLLDEITEIPITLQPKLLRVIQEQEFERVGGTQPVRIDVRFIATSNRNLEKTIQEGRFREDLYYRLNVIPLYVPPLRERKEDILPLARLFLKRFCLENHKKPRELTSQAQQELLEYPWPGNVRELANLIERAVVLDQEYDIIHAQHTALSK